MEIVSAELLAIDELLFLVDLMENDVRLVLIATASSAKSATLKMSQLHLNSVSDVATEDTSKTTVPAPRHVPQAKPSSEQISLAAAVWNHSHADLVLF